MDKKALVLGMLRGGFCRDCKYLISTALQRQGVGAATSAEWIQLDPPHCSLRTGMHGERNEKSKIENPLIQSCKNYWAPAPKHDIRWDR